MDNRQAASNAARAHPASLQGRPMMLCGEPGPSAIFFRVYLVRL